MRPSTRNSDDDLDLPPLDGETEGDDVGAAHEDLDIAEEDGGDAFDDATAGDAVDTGSALDHLDHNGREGAEGGWLLDAEDAAMLDVGGFDVSIGTEDSVLVDDEAIGGGHDDDIIAYDETSVVDGGEEGPLGADEALDEGELPALDADEEGDVPDEDLFDRSMLVEQDELRWDDRAWAKVDEAIPPPDDADESGPLVGPGEEPAQRARDATWRRLEETGRVTAATLVPGGSAIVAVASRDWGRALLVRILEDGTARIIAEVDPREDDADLCKVTHLKWDAAKGRLLAGGSFGACAFRPA